MSYQTYARTGNIYCLFYELAYRLLKTNGILAFVTSNKWMRARYGEALRKFLCENTNPTHLIDFVGQKVFDSATVDVNILIYHKCKNQYKTLSCIIKDSDWRNNLSIFMRLKNQQPPLGVDEQIANLKTLGLQVNDESYAKSVLNDISYFRLIKAYGLGLKNKNSSYDGT